ncbi:MAG: DUF177 domain-containing protein [Lachnospiraceae bacterium]
MLINLSDVLSEQHKTIEKDISLEMNEFCSELGTFPIVKKDVGHMVIEHVKDKELLINGNMNLIIAIPCARCLSDVTYKFEMRFSKNIDLDISKEERIDELDEMNYIDGYHLDVDKLFYNEILIGWPMKVLCSEDCKGICSVCGQNLNEGVCNCEVTDLDPRMSVVRDVFKNFKEV